MIAIDRGDLPLAIYEGVKLIEVPVSPWADPIALLGALAKVESSFGAMNVPRAEPAWLPGGKYFDMSLYKKWGSLAAMNFSSFQIMHPVAVELGYNKDRNPLELWNDEVAIFWVCQYIKKRILGRGASSLSDFADGFNSGTHLDKYVPTNYIEKFEKEYARVRKRRNL